VPIIRAQIVSEARALLDESGLDGLTLARRLGVKAPTLYWHVRDKADLRDAIAEYLVPEHLAFVLYAATGGDFVLGGMQALFEHDLHLALDEVAHGERRCPLDPGGRRYGRACVACLHVGEPSCRHFNRSLDRDVMFDRSTGYLASEMAEHITTS
jgi:AcrR family transcriptional regulator